MLAPAPARTREILIKRVRRLLRLHQRAQDRSELTLQIIPFLSSLGSVVLIGGAIRDVARAGRQGFSSDLDFVVHGSDRDYFVTKVERQGGTRNKFGGYGLHCFQWKVDVWHIDDTWAKTAGLVKVTRPADLLMCTFFDWDSAIYDIDSGKLVLPSDYLQRLQLNIMDIRLEKNPNPTGSLVRALRRAALWKVKFGPRLTAFSKRCLQEASWDELVALDSRAFPNPVLKYLDHGRILEQLEIPMNSPTGDITDPVPDWTYQLNLPLGNEPNSLSPDIEADDVSTT